MAKSHEFKYVKGEDRFSLECFEAFWQEIVHTHVVKNRIALIVPCTWAKPYAESWIYHYMMNGIISGSFQLISANEKALMQYMIENKKRDILEFVDLWYMSSCGFVPAEKQLSEHESGYVPFAYDWNSEFATPEDTAAWFEVTGRRQKEWVENFGEYYDSVIVYLRDGSKSLKLWRDEVDDVDSKYIQATATQEVLPAMDSQLYYQLTLNGRKTDPDLPLLNPVNLSVLSVVLVQKIKEQLGV